MRSGTNGIAPRRKQSIKLGKEGGGSRGERTIKMQNKEEIPGIAGASASASPRPTPPSGTRRSFPAAGPSTCNRNPGR
jgi:hypothetical protein